MSERKVYTIECVDGEGSLKSLIECISEIGNTGHSFSIVVDPDASELDGGNKKFDWDGDGRDRIISIKEKQIAQDGQLKPSRLKEIVDVLTQIVPLVCGGQDGGPGSGIVDGKSKTSIYGYRSQAGTIRGHGPKQDSVNKRA